MSDYLKFTILGEDKFSGTFDKLKAQMPSLRTAATAAATGIAAMGASLFAMTKSTANAYDEIRDLSNRLGVSTEELSKLKYAASLSGVEMETLSQTLKMVSNNVVDAAKGSGAAYESLNKLGISVKDLLNLSPDQQFEIIGDKLSKVGNASQKTALAMDLFGARGTAVLQMLDKGADGLNEMKKEAEALGLVIGTQAAANADAFNDALTRLQGVFTGVKNKIGEELMPIMTGFMTALSDWAIENRDKIVQWAESFLKAVAAIAEKGVYAVALLMDSWRGLVELFDITKLSILKIEEVFLRVAGKFAPGSQSIKTMLEVVKEEADETKEHLAGLIDAPLAISQADEMVKGIKMAMASLREKGTASGSDKSKTVVASMIGTAADANAAFSQIGPVIDQNYEEQYQKQQDAYKALTELHDSYFLTERQQLDKWYEEQRELFEDNDEYLKELEEVYQERKDELRESELEKEYEMVEALQELHNSYFQTERDQLDNWYAEKLMKFAGNEAALQQIRQIYAAQSKKLDQTEKKESLTRSANFFGDLATIAGAFGKKGAKMAKAFSIAETIINTYKAATGAYSAMASIPYVGPALGIAAAAAAVAAGLANVQRIKSTNVSGIAHGGMTSVPKESTYYLDKGERVLSPRQNQDLDAFMKGGGSTVNINGLNVSILPNATAGDALFSMSQTKWNDLVVEKIVPALRKAAVAGVY